MPEPLDYRNPKSRDTVRVNKMDPVQRAIPVEFDAQIARTQDLAGAQAIQAELKRQKIPFFIAGDNSVVNRWVELHVHGKDQKQASQIAEKIFARRKNLKSLPRQKMPSKGFEGPMFPSGPIW